MTLSVNLVNYVGIGFSCIRMLIGAFSVIYLISTGVSVYQIGLLKSLQAAVIVFIDIPLSYVSDKYSRKFSIGLSIFFAAIWLLLTGLGHDFTDFLIAEFFNALSLGLMSGAFSSYLIDVAQKKDPKKKIHTILGAYQKYQYFFMGLISLIGAIIFTYDQKMVWFISSILMFLLLFVCLFLPADNDNKKIIKQFNFKMDAVIIRNFFSSTSTNTRLFYITALFYGLLLQSLIQYWQVLVNQNNDVMTGVHMGIIFFIVLMSQALAGKALEQFNNLFLLKRIVYMSAITTSCLMLANYFINSLHFLYLGFAFFTCSLLSLLSNSYIIKIAPSSLQSTFLSTFSTLGKLLMFMTMPIIAFGIERFGIWTFILIFILLVFNIKSLFSHLETLSNTEDKM